MLNELNRYVGVRLNLALRELVLLLQKIVIRQNTIVRQGKTCIGNTSTKRMVVSVLFFRTLGCVPRMPNHSANVARMSEFQLVRRRRLLVDLNMPTNTKSNSRGIRTSDGGLERQGVCQLGQVMGDLLLVRRKSE